MALHSGDWRVATASSCMDTSPTCSKSTSISSAVSFSAGVEELRDKPLLYWLPTLLSLTEQTRDVNDRCVCAYDKERVGGTHNDLDDILIKIYQYDALLGSEKY